MWLVVTEGSSQLNSSSERPPRSGPGQGPKGIGKSTVTSISMRVAVCVSGQLLATSGIDELHEWGKKKEQQGPAATVVARRPTSVAENILAGLRGLRETLDLFVVTGDGPAAPFPEGAKRAHAACALLTPPSPGKIFCEVVRHEEPEAAAKTEWSQYMSEGLWEMHRSHSEPQAGLGRALLQELRGLSSCDFARNNEEIRSGWRYDWLARLRPGSVFYAPLPPLMVLASEAANALGNHEDRSFLILGRLQGALDPFMIGPRPAMEAYLGCPSALRDDPEVSAALLDHWPPGWDLEDALHVALEVRNVSAVTSPDILVGALPSLY